MTELAVVLGLALLPALGNFSGGLLAELVPTSRATLNRALHAAAGIVIAIVAVGIMPRALQATSGALVALAFGLGGLA
jgi:ZIP family zinc transporter